MFSWLQPQKHGNLVPSFTTEADFWSQICVSMCFSGRSAAEILSSGAVVGVRVDFPPAGREEKVSFLVLELAAALLPSSLFIYLFSFWKGLRKFLSSPVLCSFGLRRLCPAGKKEKSLL